MDSLYDPAEAQRHLDHYAPRHGEDLALRVYTSRLLGREPRLVLHGGGNTSVKSYVTELLGDTTEVLYVKGSGSDLATIEPRGFPACRLAHLRRCCERPSMTDEEMVAQLRGQMIDPSSPTPSVEALLHAHLPAKFIDHTHADAVLSVVDQHDAASLVREIWGDRAIFVPYVMPGFVLARRVAEIWKAYFPSAPDSRRTVPPSSHRPPPPSSSRRPGGPAPTIMILDKHGIFTWGETARESYERMILAVSQAESFVSARRADARLTLAAPPPGDMFAQVAPVARGALARASGRSSILSWRATPGLIAFSERDDLDDVSQIGCATPDHVIRTKAHPLVIAGADPSDPAALRGRIEAAVRDYAERYHDYFRRSSAARGVTKTELDPWPRVLLFPGLGVLAAGKSRAEAEVIADIYEHTAQVIDAASAIGRYRPVGELDLFDVEYWSLEQAKLAKGASAEGVLDRRVALVTGAASGIGLGTSRVLLAAGAHVLLTDRHADAVAAARAALDAKFPGRSWHAACDVTSEAEVRRAVAIAAERFGGLDLVVSNAGVASTGPLHARAGDAALRTSLEINLLGHQNVARAAAEVMIAQGSGGALLFNASKSAFNQGPEFGPYAVPKAALVALMRQYAIDLAPLGVRANAVNADRVHTELFGAGMLEARAKARGVPVDEYFKANLLKRETTVDDVARAFLYLATAEATTGCVITVDGGNAAAFPR
jgi:rhamnose utilization protein RhaD (predicted bifunctional aldolase and dehydrogenase)/NAD(P)-dependent dehydrogenase (short-subunit alcohol dehydrogenase family)